MIPKTTRTRIPEAPTPIPAPIETDEQRLERLERELAEIRVRVRARGTSDLTAAATAAVAATPVPAAPAPARGDTLAARIETALRARPMTLSSVPGLGLSSDLSVAVGARAVRINPVLQALRDDRKIYNIGSENHPIWTWILGDDDETGALIDYLEHLITIRPFTLRELIEVTGARRNRISGALVKLQVRGLKIENHGSTKVWRWYARPRR